jgi:hypothetical protein
MIHVNWIDRGGEPTQPPDPDHPDGVDLDLTRGAQPFCQTGLPYPAKRLGYTAYYVPALPLLLQRGCSGVQRRLHPLAGSFSNC